MKIKIIQFHGGFRLNICGCAMLAPFLYVHDLNLRSTKNKLKLRVLNSIPSKTLGKIKLFLNLNFFKSKLLIQFPRVFSF